MALVGYATIISFLLFTNTYYFKSITIAQRTAPRGDETQGLNEESTSVTTESQNLNGEASSTPKGQSTSQVPSRVGSSGELIDGTDRNDIIVGIEGADIIRVTEGRM